MVRRSTLNPLYRVVLISTILVVSTGKTQETMLFTTWENFEADKCASIWLIQRFIAPNAQIRFYPKGELLTEGVSFDTPDSEFRRYHNKSIFETFLEHYKITDKKAIDIGNIVHDIEINIWEKKALSKTIEVMNEMNQLRKDLNLNDHERIIQTCVSYFDTRF